MFDLLVSSTFFDCWMSFDFDYFNAFIAFYMLSTHVRPDPVFFLMVNIA